MASWCCSCQIAPNANSLVIRSTGLNINAAMKMEGEGLPMVVLYVIQRLSGYWCVVEYLLLGGLQWWPCGEAYLVCEDYRIFICVKLKIVTSVEYDC